ncbi:MAG: DUF4397 domain-containing protein [Gemmatimonadales bacterium]
MKLRLLTLGFAAAAFATACSDDDSTTAPTTEAGVRVVHASPDAPNVDVLVDDAQVLSAVPYLGASGYLDVPAGSRNVKVNAAGTSTTVIDADLPLTAGTSYTVIAGGLVSDIAPIVVEDDLSAPSSGNVKVRAVHGAPSAPAVDIYVTAPGADLAAATPTLTNVPFGAASDYLEVPAGDYQVRVTPAGLKVVVIDSGSLTLAAGQVRTAIAVDSEGGGAPFDLLVLADVN